ncbi:MAG: leucine-rich repeat domain-containing protein [Lentisphaeraceae bacterium]|nr:leucine-rich repeat domain-containing protein [Lentisphaeraceae bacterium]
MFRVIFLSLIIFLNTIGFSDDSPKIKAALKFVLDNKGEVVRSDKNKIVLVELVGNKDVKDISPLIHLKDLLYLKLERTKVKDLSPLKSLKNLMRLNISYSDVVDLSPLKSLKDLRSLSISGLQIQSLDGIKHFKNLEELYLSDTLISDLSVLRKFRSLTVLYIDDLEIKDIDPLLNLKKLEEVGLPKNIDVKLLDKFKKRHPKCKIDLR